MRRGVAGGGGGGGVWGTEIGHSNTESPSRNSEVILKYFNV